MLNVFINTIMPIFTIIALGFFLRIRNIINQQTARSLNEIIFYVAIPAMLIVKLIKFPFSVSFNLPILATLFGTLVIQWITAWAYCRLFKVAPSRRGTFMQSCLHGNLGYMAYAVAFYALDEKTFARVALLGGFLMIGQNLAAVIIMSSQNKSEKGRRLLAIGRSIILNPVILSVVLAIIISYKGWSLPTPLYRSLEILSGMAFPSALLIIGVTLSFGPVRTMVKEIVGIGVLKLFIMPFIGYTLMLGAAIPPGHRLPALILLASPPATVTYVFAIQMKGDPELAATSVSTHILLCALSYSLLLYLFHGV